MKVGRVFRRLTGLIAAASQALIVSVTCLAAGEKAYHIPPTDRHSLTSRYVDQTYQIDVSMPISHIGGDEKFPVLYVTDGNLWSDALSVMGTLMQGMGEVERFILVKVGYPSKNILAGAKLRGRDLVSPLARHYLDKGMSELNHSKAPSESLLGGALPYKKATPSTSGKEFVQFIQNELMPFIDQRYPTVVGDNNYFGYSAGGGFGVYVLFSQPDLFKRYILGSPAIGYNGRAFGLEQAKDFVSAGKSLTAKVYLSLGELEGYSLDLAPFDIAGNYYAFSRYLKQADIPGLELHLKVFPQETHNTAWMSAYVHVVKTLFGKAACLPWMQPNTCP